MKNSLKAKVVKLESIERYQRLLSKDSGTSGMKAGHVILKPNENIGEHSTEEREEVIIVLKGKGEARIDRGDILEIEGRSLLYIPAQTRHDVKNTGSGILEYIFVTSKF